MLSTIFQINCLPSCHQWEEVKKGVVKDKNSGNVYGAAHPDTKDFVRGKLMVLFFVQPFVIVPRIPYRLWGIVKGNSVHIGLQKAEKEWRLETQKWRLEDKDKGLPPPSQNSFRLKVAGKVSWQLVKDIVKVATYPIAWIGMEFATLYGSLFNPYDGRALFATLEHAWSSDELFPLSIVGGLDIQLGEYLAKCMQPQAVWKERNLYRFADHYHPDTLRNVLRNVEFSLKNQKEFFEKENVLTSILTCVDDYQKNIKDYSLRASEEVKIGQNNKQRLIRSELEKILNNLQEIEKLNDKLFFELNQPNAPSPQATLDELEDCKQNIQEALDLLNDPDFQKRCKIEKENTI